MRKATDTYFKCVDCKAPFKLPFRYWHSKDQAFTTDLPFATTKPLCTDCYDRRFIAHARKAMA